MNKPKKPVKRRAPRKLEKPQEYFDRKDYTIHLDNDDEFFLAHKIQSLGVNIEDVDIKSIWINVEIDTSDHWSAGNDSELRFTVNKKHKNLNYESELKAWNKNQKDWEKYYKDIEKYEKELEKYNRDLPKWVAYEQKQIELEQIESAKELLKSKGLM